MGDYGILDALEDLDELERSDLSAEERMETIARIRELISEIEKTGLLIGDDS